MWERYCRGVNAIVFMVDAADEDKLEGLSVVFILLGSIYRTDHGKLSIVMVSRIFTVGISIVKTWRE